MHRTWQRSVFVVCTLITIALSFKKLWDQHQCSWQLMCRLWGSLVESEGNQAHFHTECDATLLSTTLSLGFLSELSLGHLQDTNLRDMLSLSLASSRLSPGWSWGGAHEKWRGSSKLCTRLKFHGPIWSHWDNNLLKFYSWLLWLQSKCDWVRSKIRWLYAKCELLKWRGNLPYCQ